MIRSLDHTAPADVGLSSVGEWTRTLEAHTDYVYSFLSRCGVSGAELEDMVQEVLMVMWRRRISYDPQRPLRPWIAGIAVRVVRDTRRRSWRELPRGFVDAPDEAAKPEQHLAELRARSLVRGALARLPDKQRTVFVMHELQGIPMREIADALSVPLFTLYSRYKKAKVTFGKEVRRAVAIGPVVRGGEDDARPALITAGEAQ